MELKRDIHANTWFIHSLDKKTLKIIYKVLTTFKLNKKKQGSGLLYIKCRFQKYLVIQYSHCDSCV